MAAKGMADRKMTASFLEEVKEEAGRATEQLLLQAKTEPGDILIVGCSSSEIVGERIGTFSSVETAQAVRDFQSKNGLCPTGNTDLETFNMLYNKASKYTDFAQNLKQPFCLFLTTNRRSFA